MSKKINIIVAIAVVLIIASTIGVIISFGKNKQDQTMNAVIEKSAKAKTEKTSSESLGNKSEWLSHQDDEWQIEYKYPSDWKKVGDEANTPEWITDTAGEKNIILYKKSVTQNLVRGFPLDARISIRAMANPGDLSLQEIFRKNNEDCLKKEKRQITEGKDPGFGCGSLLDVSTWNKIEVNSKSALQSGIQYSEGDVYGTDSVYIQLPKKFLIISATSYNNQYSTQFVNDFNEFISNFKFTQ